MYSHSPRTERSRGEGGGDLHIFIGVWNYLIEFVWKFLLN